MVVVNEITIEEILVFVIVLIVFIIILTVISIYPYVHNKIHSSYHKGYNESRKDKYNYFESLRDIDDTFTKVMTNVKKKDLEIDVNFLSDLIDFGNKVRKYKNKD